MKQISNHEWNRTAKALADLQSLNANLAAENMRMRVAVDEVNAQNRALEGSLAKLVDTHAEMMRRVGVLLPWVDFDFPHPENYDEAETAHKQITAYLATIQPTATTLEDCPHFKRLQEIAKDRNPALDRERGDLVAEVEKRIKAVVYLESEWLERYQDFTRQEAEEGAQEDDYFGWSPAQAILTLARQGPHAMGGGPIDFQWYRDQPGISRDDAEARVRKVLAFPEHGDEPPEPSTIP